MIRINRIKWLHVGKIKTDAAFFLLIVMSGSSDLNKVYKSLMAKAKEMAVLGSAAAIVQWDMETKMPPGAIQLRSQQLAMLQQIIHKMATSPEIGKLLDSVEKHRDFDGLTQVEIRNIHLMRKDYDEATKLPEELVVEIAKQQAITVDTWKKAKAAKDYGMFKPELEKMIELTKRSGDILMEVKGTQTRYDALIDMFEPKMTTKTINKHFTEMRDGLRKLLDRILAEDKPDISFLSRPMSVETQVKVTNSLASFIDYDISSDKARGRIDETEHPFTTGYYDDVRVTTKYHEDNWAANFYSVLHEGGHALYELGLPQEWMYQPLGTGAGMGVHESMSRFVENYVGKSPEFWEYYLPELKKLTGSTLKDVSMDKMIAAVNYVTPSKIRIEADEVTYGLHIIIRFEMEQEIMNNALPVDEFPQLWNQKYKDYLGLDIENDSEGVMQDTHWATGYYGYFPSYALGNLYDGVWSTKLDNDLPDWKQQIAGGSFKELKNWLTENVYKYGNLYDPEDLVKTVTGRELAVKPFMNYLDEKFQNIYNN